MRRGGRSPLASREKGIPVRRGSSRVMVTHPEPPLLPEQVSRLRSRRIPEVVRESCSMVATVKGLTRLLCMRLDNGLGEPRPEPIPLAIAEVRTLADRARP